MHQFFPSRVYYSKKKSIFEYFHANETITDLKPI